MKKWLAKLVLRKAGGVSKTKTGAIAGVGAGSFLVIAIRQYVLNEFGLDIPPELLAGAIGLFLAKAYQVIGMRDAVEED